MDFSAWLRDWLSRHPLQEPPDADRRRYTGEVMARVKALQGATEPPAVQPVSRWLRWPRVTLALATGAAGIVVAVGVLRFTPPPGHPAPASHPVVRGLSPPRAADEPAQQDTQLAESSPGEDYWLERTWQLLEELDERFPNEDTAESSDEQWLEELQWIDESEMTAS